MTRPDHLNRQSGEGDVPFDPDTPTAEPGSTTRRTAMAAFVALTAPLMAGSRAPTRQSAAVDQRGDPRTGLSAAGSSNGGSGGQAAAVTFRQLGSENSQALQVKLQRVVDVDDFRLPADTDDTAAFKRAVASLVATGGEIRTDPKKRYEISATIVIASIHHIAITGGNFGLRSDANGSGIAITSPMPSLFRVVAPVARGEHGGVTLRNLSFFDATGGLGGDIGKNEVTRALLDLYDATSSVVENCQFHFINGSVIRTDYFVQSSIVGCRIRYCGAVGKKVIHLGGATPAFGSQAVTIHDTRIEVCYGDAYLHAEASSQAVSISACVFEAATAEYPKSNTTFLDLNGIDYKVIGCSFNRNLATALVLRGRGIVTACSFVTGEATSASVLVLGAHNILSANTFTDTRRGCSVRVVGVSNLLTGNCFFASGGIILEGANNQFHQNIIDNPTMIEGDYSLTLADYCVATGNHFNGYDFTGTGYKPAVNGVALFGTHAVFTNNTCRGWRAKTFIHVRRSPVTVQSNVHDGVGIFVKTDAAP